jgi:PadR family transcriptional regulator, regulatory protein PadR
VLRRIGSQLATKDHPMIRELFLGFIRVHILFHAADAPVFGVALMAELGRHGYQVGPGTLYPILHALARAGYLHQEGAVVNGKVRKYYRITPAGRRILARAQTQLHELVAEVLPVDRSQQPRKRLGTRRKTR